MLRRIRIAAAAFGGGCGLLLAIRQILAQRDFMLFHKGWVCATDWPGFLLLDVTLGIACALIAVHLVCLPVYRLQIFTSWKEHDRESESEAGDQEE